MTIHAISVLCVPHVESTPQKTQDGDEPDCAHGEVFLDDDDDDDDDGIHDDDDDDGDDDDDEDYDGNDDDDSSWSV